jgi:two-component system sensor histidine kinase EvgS
MRLWDRYVRFYFDHFTPVIRTDEEGLPFLRDKLFVSVLLFTLPVCAVADIPAIIISIKTNQPFIAIFDAAALAVLFLVSLLKSISLEFRKVFFTLIFYALGVMLIFFLGITGPGPVILFSSSILVSLYQNRRAGQLCVLANTVILSVFLIILPLSGWEMPAFDNYNIAGGIGIGSSLIAFNMLVVISVAYVVERLNESFLMERSLQVLAARAEREIKDLNQNLEKKIGERTAQLADANEKLVLEIQDHIRAEDDLEKARHDADVANRAKSDFLASMSHEIRTPLNAILGYTELLGYSIRERQQTDYLTSIQTSGRTLLTLINDILDLSKIEAGKLQLEYEIYETTPFFNEFERIFAFRAASKKLRFITEIAGSIPSCLMLDGDRIRQIIMNLAGNAINYTEKGEVKLRIYPLNEDVKISADGKVLDVIDLVIEVSDTGIGIPMEYQKEIFGSFFQVSKRTGKEGTGLGLAITRKLVSLMDGTIDLVSEPGSGSTFKVRIPAIPCFSSLAGKNEIHSFNPSLLVFSPAKVIIVDDIPENRSYLRSVLSGTSLTVIEARNGLEGLELIRKVKPDLVIADIVMPGLSGYELLGNIRADEELKNIPVLAYSASVMQEDQNRIRNSDFSGLLVKPVRVSDVFRELMKILPYTMLREEDLTENETFEDNRALVDCQGLVDVLEKNFIPLWKKFESRQPLSEVKSFGEDLLVLGEKHNCTSLAGYGRELTEAVEEFNVDRIMKLLSVFPEKMDHLKKLS